MAIRQQEYILGLKAKNGYQCSVDLPFTPSEIYVINNTSNPLYIRRGSCQIPTATFYDYKVNAQANGIAGSVKLPTNASQFGLFLPSSPALTDTAATVQVIFRGSDIPYRNYQEFVVDTLVKKKR